MTLPAGHTIVLSIAEDGRPARVIGTSRSTNDVPALLRAIAGRWESHGTVPIEGPDGYDPIADWRSDFS
jgi:hypothetical protein